MVVFFLSVALTNLALGYALALYLHPHGEGSGLFPLERPTHESAPAKPAAAVSEKPAAPAIAATKALVETNVAESAATATPVEYEQPAAVPAVEQPTAEVQAAVEPTVEPVVDRMVVTVEPTAELPATPTAATIEPMTEPTAATMTPIAEPIAAATATAETGTPEVADVSAAELIEREELQRSLDLFKSQLQNYRTQVTGLDQRVHRCTESADGANGVEVQTCLRDLRGMNHEFFEHQMEASDQLAKSAGPAQADARTRVNAAVAAQAAQMSDIDCGLIELDPAADPKACAEQLLGETAKLLQSTETFAVMLEDIEKEVQSSQKASDSEATEKPLLKDNLAPPQALRAAITARLEQSPEQLLLTCVALIDVDRVGELNTQFGEKVIDRVLQRVTFDADDAVAGGGLLAAEDGQRLLLLLPPSTSSAAVDLVERIRQLTAATKFTHQEKEFTASVSCGIAQAVAGDTLQSLLERAASTLQEAKRYGRNRSFALEDKYPAPVAPPALAIEPRTVPV